MGGNENRCSKLGFTQYKIQSDKHEHLNCCTFHKITSEEKNVRDLIISQ
jgi:hypothetical protein